MKWRSIEKYPPPRKESILAAWIYDEYIEGVEWYLIDDADNWWNLNSNNLNIFNEDHPPPTHWCEFEVKVSNID